MNVTGCRPQDFSLPNRHCSENRSKEGGEGWNEIALAAGCRLAFSSSTWPESSGEVTHLLTSTARVFLRFPVG